tara:strand:- start:204 stop:746 length:543 start_codon:yes stop_codon:yes gene_type:complete
MANIAKVENGSVVKYPYNITDLRKEYPNVSFPKNALTQAHLRQHYNAVEVEVAKQPFEKGYKFENMHPVKRDDGSWVEEWDKIVKESAEVDGSDLILVDSPDQDANGNPIGQEYEAVEGTAEKKSDGKWYQTWILEEMTWLQKRIVAYGPIEEQVEFIAENGLEAWQTKVSEIKAKYPKT